MSAYERDVFSFSSSKGFPQPFESFGMLTGAMQLWAGNITRTSLEAGGFLSRRARANLELPNKLSHCRTMQDVMAAGAEYWTAALNDMVESQQRMLGIWAGKNPLAAGFASMAEEATAAMTKPLREAMATVTDDKQQPWEWWRTDLKGIVPRRNGADGHHATE